MRDSILSFVQRPSRFAESRRKNEESQTAPEMHMFTYADVLLSQDCRLTHCNQSMCFQFERQVFWSESNLAYASAKGRVPLADRSGISNADSPGGIVPGPSNSGQIDRTRNAQTIATASSIGFIKDEEILDAVWEGHARCDGPTAREEHQ